MATGVWLKDLVKVLRQAGVPVQGMTYKLGRYAGKDWKQVGYNGLGYRELRGIMWHHDASPFGDSPGALDWCMYWAKDADGNDLTPAASIWVDRYGKWFVYAAGQSCHAGVGSSPLAPNSTGNQVYLGIETDHNVGEKWPKEQIDSLRKGTAALMKHYSLDPKVALEFHKTYAPGRKNDPDGLNLTVERRRVSRLMKSDQTGIKALLDRWFGRSSN
jgi:hypothetical protein